MSRSVMRNYEFSLRRDSVSIKRMIRILFVIFATAAMLTVAVTIERAVKDEKI